MRIGAYVAGSDPRIDMARMAVPKIEEMIKQRHDQATTREEAYGALAAIAAMTGGT